MPPITTTSRLIGRRNAARLTRCRSSGESRSANEGCSPVPPRRSGLRITPRGVLCVVTFLIFFEKGQAHPAAQLQRESSGSVTLVHGQAQALVGVWHEDEIPNLGVTESLGVADWNVAPLAGFGFEQRAEPEVGFFRPHREPGIAIAVHADDGGRD